MNDCLFCKIARGEIPSKAVYEDELTFAFRDIAPQTPTHVLVIPKRHIANWYEARGAEDALLAGMMRAAAKVAELEGLTESGFRVVSNTGADARQTVQHLHMHVMGGCEMTEKMG